MNKINICSSEGSPINPRTWSGTPFHLYSEFKEMGCLDSAFETKIGKWQNTLLICISKLVYGSTYDVRRGYLIRYANAALAKRKTAKSACKSTLHTGALDLPFLLKPSGQRHYIYSDSTWNLWSNASTSIDNYPKKLVKDAERLEFKAYQQAEHIFSISEYVKDNLISKYGINPDKITVVGTGLGVIKPFFGEKNYKNGKILFAAKGRFEDKGGPMVLEAFEKALRQNPDLELIIVGQNEYAEKKLPNVKAYGFIPIEELQSIFDECSLFLMPALNEPWGLVYLEALACKMPIVGLNRNSFPEISGYGKYGFGLDEPDSDKLSQVILSAFSDDKALAEIGLRGQEYCLENFSWRKTAARIIDKINEIEQ
ncbi:MAG: glycosyltransferase family 4 protein [Dysgonamonadaceae bacterium]|nr:glycosyltransferase family 4 protein [Dysgonamonadaceae bacterium]